MQRQRYFASSPSLCLSTVDLVTRKFQANKHSPLAISQQPVGQDGNSAKSTAGQKPCTALYMFLEKKDTAMPTKATYSTYGTLHNIPKLLQKCQAHTFIVLHWAMGHCRE
jgi:hypothetical protein